MGVGEQSKSYTGGKFWGVGDLFLNSSCYLVNRNTLSLPTQNVIAKPTSSHGTRPSVSVRKQ